MIGPNPLSHEIGRIHETNLQPNPPRPGAGRATGSRRRGLGEQLDAVRRRLELGRSRRTATASVWMGRYTGARV